MIYSDGEDGGGVKVCTHSTPNLLKRAGGRRCRDSRLGDLARRAPHVTKKKPPMLDVCFENKRKLRLPPNATPGSSAARPVSDTPLHFK